MSFDSIIQLLNSQNENNLRRIDREREAMKEMIKELSQTQIRIATLNQEIKTNNQAIERLNYPEEVKGDK